MAAESADSLGSAAWIGAGAYDPGDEYHNRATDFMAAVKWDTLKLISSRLRQGVPCELSDKYSIGHFNLVRRIIFADGVSWVARLRLPELRVASGGDLLDMQSIFRLEIASMKLLK